MIEVRILTPEWNRMLEVDAIFLPGVLGEFEILPNHTPIISTLAKGRLRWRIGDKEETLSAEGGVARLDHNVLDICLEKADRI